jgi:hypothetical protein
MLLERKYTKDFKLAPIFELSNKYTTDFCNAQPRLIQYSMSVGVFFNLYGNMLTPRRTDRYCTGIFKGTV